MKKRLTLLLLTALLVPSSTMPGCNKRRRHESFTLEVAEEPLDSGGDKIDVIEVRLKLLVAF